MGLSHFKDFIAHIFIFLWVLSNQGGAHLCTGYNNFLNIILK